VVRSVVVTAASALLVAGCATGSATSPPASRDELRGLRADVAELGVAVARIHAEGDRVAADLRRSAEQRANDDAERMGALTGELGRLSTALVEVMARVDRLAERAEAADARVREHEARVAESTGALERTVAGLTESVAGLQGSVTSLQQDVARVSSAAAPDRAVSADAAAPARGDDGNSPAASPAPLAAPVAPGVGGPAPVAAVPAPVAVPAVPRAPALPAIRGPRTEPSRAQDLYDTAYIDFSRGNYSLAIGGFGELIRRFPDDPLAENAQYWIGEAHWGLARSYDSGGQAQRGRDARRQAVKELAKVVDQYRRSDKAPVALYRQALILIELGETAQARERLQQLVDGFPQAAESRLAREQLSRAAD
jgi:TolA-binding protein